METMIEIKVNRKQGARGEETGHLYPVLTLKAPGRKIFMRLKEGFSERPQTEVHLLDKVPTTEHLATIKFGFFWDFVIQAAIATEAEQHDKEHLLAQELAGD